MDRAATDELPLDVLLNRCRGVWPAIEKARREARARLEQLKLPGGMQLPDNLSLVFFGSFGRLEWTSKSDVDWTLLIDGPADPEHFRLVSDVQQMMDEANMPQPGATGIFGSFASSHDLIHHVGGVDDTNTNLTRRMLLLLESAAPHDSVVHGRVLRGILHRYVVCDQSVSTYNRQQLRTPRFLLNDVVRFWRTMAVDYASKKWQQPTGKWALRNAKLRMSRKLLFAAGMLMCLDCEARPRQADPAIFEDPDDLARQLANHILHLCRMTPLDLLASYLETFADDAVTRSTLGAYDQFLALLDDEAKRASLEKLSTDDALAADVFKEVRRIGHEFQAGLDQLFFSEPLLPLVKKYGVF